MFNKIMAFLKGGLVKMGLVKSLGSISEHEDIALNAEMFDKIDVWKSLYKGHYKEWHELKYHTLNGRKTRTMNTLGLAKIVASEMASLVYNEKCDISIDNDSVAELIESVFSDNKFDKKFQDYLEYSFAHGGMVIKPYYENKKIKLSFVTADSFIPVSWKNDSIYEAVFPFEFIKKGKKYTHLEWHLWIDDVYVIKNEVYESQSGSDLGIKVSLKEHLPGVEEETKIENIKRSIFSYFKTNTANNIDTNSPLGISIFANALDTMKAIDIAFDSLVREFRLGKKRIFVPQHMIKAVVNPQTGTLERYFDADDESYESFGTEQDDVDIKDVTVELRVDEHVSAINALLNIFAMQTGFSSGAFTFDGQSMKTATEVVSEQSKTFKTKQSHEVIIEAALQELIGSIVVLGQLYKLVNVDGEYEVTVNFDDSIAEDASAEIEKQTKLVAAEMQSRKRAIIKIFGVTEEEAELIMTEIIEENKTFRPEPDFGNEDSLLFGSGE